MKVGVVSEIVPLGVLGIGVSAIVKLLAALKVFHTPPTIARTFHVCAAAPKTFVGVLDAVCGIGAAGAGSNRLCIFEGCALIDRELVACCSCNPGPCESWRRI